MKGSNLNQLIKRYLAGETSPEETAKLEAWLDVMKTSQGTDLKLSDHDEERLFQEITSSVTSVEQIVSLRHEFGMSRRFSWLKVAAIILPLLAASYGVWYTVIRQQTFEIVASHEAEKTILQDGTIVWLSKNAKLIYTQTDAGIRQASLTGEALFEVAKDPEHPFTVSCGNINVKVLGTSFSLRTESNRVELKVLTGKVHVTSDKDPAGIDALPNEKIVCTNQEMVRVQMEASEKEAIAAIEEYDMRFEKTPMQKVIARIEKKFDVKVKLENDHVNQCRVTVDLTDHSLEESWSLLADILDIGFKIDGKDVAVSGRGCN